MYKKAGIIVGSLLIVLAVAIFLIANAASGSKDTDKAQTTAGDTVTIATSAAIQTATPITQAVQTQATVSAVVAPSTDPILTTTQALSAPIETTTFNAEEFTSTTLSTVATTSANLIALDVTTLPTNIVDTSDIGTVVDKRVYAYNGQVIYSLIINTTTNGQLEYFCTKNNYDLALNTRVTCDIRIYVANSGNFPSIMSIHVA